MGTIRHILKYLLFSDYRSTLNEMKETKRLKRIPRYTPCTATLRNTEILLVDAASFLFIYDEIFNRHIYKFYSSRPDPYIIDCGANIGLSIIYFKQMYPGARIIGFEPDPGAFYALKSNIDRFGLMNVELIMKGVWDKSASLDFFAEGADGGRIAIPSDSRNIKTIETVRLKDYLDKPVDFLKLDIEGSETAVIKDCADSLRYVERLFVEYHSFSGKQQDLDVLLKTLSDAGFRYNIHQIGIFSPTPFTEVRSSLSIDNQLNIFAYR